MEDKNNEATKSSNPKFALGIKKVPTHCIPPAVKLEIGLAMMEGGRKYGTYNWREEGVKATAYYDASNRHLDAWLEGEDDDPASDISHVTKAIASLVVLRDSMLFGNFIDDRPQRQPDGFDMEKYNRKAEEIIKKYPECKKPFTQMRKYKEEQAAQLETKDSDKAVITVLDYLMHPLYCMQVHNELGEIQTWEDDKDEEYGEFTIRKPRDPGKGWYAILTVFNGKGVTFHTRKFLHKDCKIHRSTGYNSSEHGYAEAPGYFKSKAHAREYIHTRIILQETGFWEDN